MPAMNHTHPGEDLVVDVAVVGGGVIGLATAWRLRRDGLTVAVIDPTPGRGASHAAAGMLAPASEVRWQQDELLPLMTTSAAEYPLFVREIEAAAGHAVGHSTTETLLCAADPADRQSLADLQQHQVWHGLRVEPLTGRRARALEPALSPRLAGAFLVPDDHQVDPRRLVVGLLSALTAPGGGPPARLVPDTAVETITGAKGAVGGVRLPDGSTVTAAETVLAPGLGLPRISGLPTALDLPLRPVHGDILRARLPEGAPPLLSRTVRGLVGGRPVYLVPRPDGEIVLGATAREDGIEQPTTGGVHALLRDAQALVPAAADLELHEVLARARPASPDDLPFLGRVRDADGRPVPGLVVSTGYFRHGILLAPWAARLTATLLTEAGGRPEDADHLAVVDPQRFAAAADRTGPGARDHEEAACTP